MVPELSRLSTLALRPMPAIPRMEQAQVTIQMTSHLSLLSKTPMADHPSVARLHQELLVSVQQVPMAKIRKRLTAMRQGIVSMEPRTRMAAMHAIALLILIRTHMEDKPHTQDHPPPEQVTLLHQAQRARHRPSAGRHLQPPHLVTQTTVHRRMTTTTPATKKHDRFQVDRVLQVEG